MASSSSQTTHNPDSYHALIKDCNDYTNSKCNRLIEIGMMQYPHRPRTAAIFDLIVPEDVLIHSKLSLEDFNPNERPWRPFAFTLNYEGALDRIFNHHSGRALQDTENETPLWKYGHGVNFLESSEILLNPGYHGVIVYRHRSDGWAETLPKPLSQWEYVLRLAHKDWVEPKTGPKKNPRQYFAPILKSTFKQEFEGRDQNGSPIMFWLSRGRVSRFLPGRYRGQDREEFDPLPVNTGTEV